jgi:pyruvate/2-oxoglutarate dehydrogenase complex dihydrolipoamide dehydrogenase (E3) component
MERFDLMVIGGGSAGLKAARTAAKLGARVALAEERETGGECYWAGCVPTKAMIRAAAVWSLIRRAPEFGICVEVKQADFADAMAYKDRAVYAVGGGGEPDAGLGRIGVRYYPKQASFLESHTIRVGREEIYAERVIIATGTVPAVPPIPGLAEVGYITNREAVHLTALPRSLVVLGAGPIGLEFAQTFHRFGAAVTVVEMAERILPNEDADICAMAESLLTKEGLTILTGASAVKVERGDRGEKRVMVKQREKTILLEAEEILVAVGRAAATGGLQLEAAGVEATPRAIHADSFLRTSQPHIWAAGDVNGGLLFTHVASYEGKIAALNAFSQQQQSARTKAVPRATYIDPEVASIGLTEAQAREAGIEADIYASSFENLDRAILHGEPRGLVKLVVERRSEQILGAHMIGPQADSLLAEIALAMQNRLPLSAIADTMHAYPTFPEAVEAAALAFPRPL